MTTPQGHDGPGELRVEAVRSRRELERFIRVPWSVYAQDPHWIPPLIFERKEHLSAKNPYFRHAIWQAWVALRGDQPVGRISAQVDQLRLEKFRDQTGSFGFLEAVDDHAVFELLVDSASGWLRGQGMQRMQGPFNLSINDECGMLVDGFDTSPYVMMGHAHRYYQDRLTELGFSKARDLLAYRVNLKSIVTPRAVQKLIAKNSQRISTRPFNRAQMKDELVILRDLFNDAWSANWGFVPFTKLEFDQLGQNLTHLVDQEFIQIASLDGEPAAMIVALPNLNEAARDLNGRLFPLGWAKLLWRLKIGRLRTARVTLMGVRQQWQKSRVGMALAQAVIDAVRIPLIERGFEQVEMSWILEDNAGMRNIIESLGGDPYKRYRIYQRDI